MARKSPQPYVATQPVVATPQPNPVPAQALAATAFPLGSMNVEATGKRLHTHVLPFVARHHPMVLCLQEVNGHELHHFGQLGYTWQRFAPMMSINGEVQGIAIVAQRPPDASTSSTTYWLNKLAKVQAPRRLSMPDGYKMTDPTTVQYAVLAASFHGVRVLNTHQMVTHKGSSTPEQQAMARRIITHALAQQTLHGNVLLGGDFNAPRNRATWDMFAEAFRDNIPPHVQTTLDATLHTYGQNPDFPKDFVVDGLFSGGANRVWNVQLYNGVADHFAITAMVQTL